MASKRDNGSGAWEYRIKSKLLAKPVYATFSTVAEGDAWAKKVEDSLKAGVVPEWLLKKPEAYTVGGLITAFSEQTVVAPSTAVRLGLVKKDWGETTLGAVDYAWVKGVVAGRREKKNTPVSIHRYMNALAQALDWAVREKWAEGLLKENPVRLLPAGYAHYPDKEVEDEERDRRLEPGEEETILAALADEPAYRLMVVMALETAMRLSEIYTLQPGDVDVKRRTIFLRKENTKTRVARQIPMSSVMVRELVGFKGFGHEVKSVNASARISKYFQRLFKKLELDDLHFHDFRHEATCRFVLRTKFSDVQIMRITGHRSPKEFLRYASLRASEMVDGMW